MKTCLQGEKRDLELRCPSRPDVKYLPHTRSRKADSLARLPEFTGFAEELPRMAWTCSSTSSLTIVNGISATAEQEGLMGPAVENKIHWRSRQAHCSCPYLGQEKATACQLSKGS
jgi:hypothetical protein